MKTISIILVLLIANTACVAGEISFNFNEPFTPSATGGSFSQTVFDQYGNEYNATLSVTTSSTLTNAGGVLGAVGNGSDLLDPGDSISFTASVTPVSSGHLQFQHYGVLSHTTPPLLSFWGAYSNGTLRKALDFDTETDVNDINSPNVYVQHALGNPGSIGISGVSFVASTPEPSSLLLLSLGVAGGAFAKRRRKISKSQAAK